MKRQSANPVRVRVVFDGKVITPPAGGASPFAKSVSVTQTLPPRKGRSRP
jgi:hypothetical protein